jgi:hypothetical protein
MFRALFAHHQEAVHAQQLVCFVRIMLAGCYHGWSGTVNKKFILLGLLYGKKKSKHKIKEVMYPFGNAWVGRKGIYIRAIHFRFGHKQSQV